MASKFAKDGSTIYNNEQIRIVMVGKTGVGKSASGNTILGKRSKSSVKAAGEAAVQWFASAFSFESQTENCSKASSEVDGQEVAVIDTPGLCDTRFDEEETSRNVGQCIYFASPGPHIFLIIIKLDRFTEEEKRTVQNIQKIFGEGADKYSMVLFTHGKKLGGRPIEEFLKQSKDLQKLVARCNGQCHVFDNELKDRSQVRELLTKIRQIMDKNGGSHYTTEMFQEAERDIEENKRQILKEKEEEHRKQQEEQERIMAEEHEKEMKKRKAEAARRELALAQEREALRKRQEMQDQQEREARQEAERRSKSSCNIL